MADRVTTLSWMPRSESPVNDTPHPSFDRPSTNSKLWRYMDLPKYLAMLDSESLWFSRADLLGDPFEGSMSQANVRMRPDVYADQIPASALDMIAAARAQDVRHTYVSCWHENEYESAAMWRLYSVGHGIAVQTNYGRMRGALDYESDIFVGRVRYADYTRDWISEGDIFAPFVYKRLSFQHEREVRAIVSDVTRRHGTVAIGAGLDRANPPAGVAVVVDLAQFVEQVRVSPEAPSWFAVAIQSLTSKYGFNFPVVQSELAVDPVY